MIAALYRHEWQEGGWSRQAARLAGGDSHAVGPATSDAPSQVMTWREFLGRFAVEFDLAAEDGLSDRRLVADLGFDSLERLRVELFVESLLSSFRLPEQLGMDDIRVADLYHYYEVAWTRQHGGDSSDGPEAV